MEDIYRGYDQRGIAAVDVVLAMWGLTYERVDNTTLTVPVERPYPLVLTSIHVTGEQMVVESLYPFMAPSLRRSRAMELVARLNYRQGAGALTADPDDGELGFRTCIPLRPHRITVGLAADVLEQHWSAANRLISGVAAVVFTDLSVRAAMAQCAPTSPIDDVLRHAAEQLDAD